MTIPSRARRSLALVLACALPCAGPSLGHAASVLLEVPLVGSSGQTPNIQGAYLDVRLTLVTSTPNATTVDDIQASAWSSWFVPDASGGQTYHASPVAASPKLPFSDAESYEATFLFSGADLANQALWFGHSGYLPPISLVDQTTGASIALGEQTCASNCSRYAFVVRPLGSYLNAADTYKLTMTGLGSATLLAGVPEPATWQLMLMAPCLLVGLRRLHRRAA
jgi:hypothetical protein